MDVAFEVYPLLDRVLERVEHALARAYARLATRVRQCTREVVDIARAPRSRRARAACERGARVSRARAHAQHARTRTCTRKPCATCDDAEPARPRRHHF